MRCYRTLRSGVSMTPHSTSWELIRRGRSRMQWQMPAPDHQDHCQISCDTARAALLVFAVAAGVNPRFFWRHNWLGMEARVVNKGPFPAPFFGGEAENICSHRVFRILTQCMVRPCVARGFVNLADAVLH